MNFSRHLRVRVTGALVIAALVLAGCHPIFGGPSGPIRYGTLTATSHMKYHYTGDAASVIAQPGLPVDDNVREVFWYDSAQWYANQQSCITWSDAQKPTGSEPLQPGLAMRIAPVKANNTGIRAVTVTQNVFYGAYWLFNVHVWNSINTASPFTLIQTFDLSSIVGKVTVVNGEVISTLAALPWHLCARSVGRQLSFMVWTGDNPQPSWSSATQVFRATLPSGWDQAGYSGGYVGHLRQGQAERFTGVTSTPLCNQPDGSHPTGCISS